MDTIIGYEKTNKNSLSAIYEKLDNAPKLRHNYINGKLWIYSIGDLYNCKKECEKNREKKYDRLHEFNFFGSKFYGNVFKKDYKKIIESLK